MTSLIFSLILAATLLLAFDSFKETSDVAESDTLSDVEVLFYSKSKRSQIPLDTVSLKT